MTEVPLGFPRVWVEFHDPAAEQVIRADLTWLTSRWTCTFGAGCRGIYADAPDFGCCTLGAHFVDKADRKNVQEIVAQLDESVWQFAREGQKNGWIEKEDGAKKTRVYEGACIFMNRPEFSGGAGCALHLLALRQQQAFHTYKPQVCWQLPLRRTYRQVDPGNGEEYLELSLGEYTRTGWGPGGTDLDWYCSSNTEAHVGDEPVYVSQEAELRELIGDESYEVLVGYCEEHLAAEIGMHPATAAASRNPR